MIHTLTHSGVVWQCLQSATYGPLNPINGPAQVRTCVIGCWIRSSSHIGLSVSHLYPQKWSPHKTFLYIWGNFTNFSRRRWQTIKMVNKLPWIIGFGCQIASFVLCSLSYGTGYWLVAEGKGRLFKRLGLWEACFDGYEHTSDYIGKAYYGCWWIFHKEYSYIRSWIMPCKYVG